MIGGLYDLAKPVIFKADAERTHDAVMAGLSRVSRNERLLGLTRGRFNWEDPRLAVDLFGVRLANPLIVAAGLDKNGRAVAALNALGFALVEVGTVTPRFQAGKPKPRVFRLPEDEALINRMGFPSEGMDAVAAHLADSIRGSFALNVGPNMDRVEQAAEDCLAGIRRLAIFAPTYIVINVSSPNTAHLRKLQGREALDALLGEVKAGLPAAVANTPLLIKIAPDLSDQEIDELLQVVSDVQLHGVVATNTTTARPASLRGTSRTEQGGLSGRPLYELSNRVIGRIASQSGGKLTILAAGGVMSGADALHKIALGATAVQLYTGFVYGGPESARRIKQEMAAELHRTGATSLAELRGSAVTA